MYIASPLRQTFKRLLSATFLVVLAAAGAVQRTDAQSQAGKLTTVLADLTQAMASRQTIEGILLNARRRTTKGLAPTRGILSRPGKPPSPAPNSRRRMRIPAWLGGAEEPSPSPAAAVTKPWGLVHAEALALTIPVRGTLVTAYRHYLSFFESRAAARKTKVFPARPAAAPA